MDKISEAQEIPSALGLPVQQQNEISALTLLALCGIKPESDWGEATRQALTITKGIMAFISKEYGKSYAPNTRETFRRQVLHQFVQARIVDYNPNNPSLPTNSPRAHYALTEAALEVISAYRSSHWNSAVRSFIAQQGSLLVAYQRKQDRQMIPLRLSNGKLFKLSPGKHNLLEAAIIQEFAPRFVRSGQILYLGDTAKKTLFMDAERLKALGVNMTEHDKLPDIILYDTERNWLFLIEAVISHGPMTPKRLVELQNVFRNCEKGLVFVSAFRNFAEFHKRLKEIAWETEVWISEIPDHLIHFNGDRFLGPR